MRFTIAIVMLAMAVTFLLLWLAKMEASIFVEKQKSKAHEIEAKLVRHHHWHGTAAEYIQFVDAQIERQEIA